MDIIKPVIAKPAQKIQQEIPEGIPRHPFFLPVLIFFILFFAACVLFINSSGNIAGATDTKVVRVFVDGQQHVFPTHASTVGDLLKRLNIEVLPDDVVEPNLNSPILEDNFSVNVYRARPITVVDEDGTKVTAKIAESNARELAKKAGVKINPEDWVYFDDPTKAAREGIVGDLITIDRAVPVKLDLYGKEIRLLTHAKTVGDLLNEKQITLDEKDKVKPSLDTKIKTGMLITLLTNGKKIVTVEEDIPPPVKVEYDATMKVGETRVIDPGQEGKRVVTYEIHFENGKAVSRKELKSVVSREPELRKEIRGTKTAGFSGGFASALASLRSCEGSYTSNTGNGYYGAYQFDIGTWGGYGGYSNAAQAPPAVQDQKARETYEARGWSPWPTCSSSLGLQDVYR